MSAISRRTAQGGLIERDKPLRFQFNGRPLQGFAGDTLASALVANGVQLTGRSFKYHRPRGILSAGSEEPNALVELRSGARREPNIRATMIELYDGLEAASQNHWPSLEFDALAINQLAAPFLTAGFYYKTFKWPQSFWEKLYEPAIRRAAGLGRASHQPDPDTYEKSHAFCDVLIIGGGPAGLMAALSASRAGARVILADEDFRFGGRLLCERAFLDGEPAARWVDRVIGELTANPDVALLPRTTVFGAYDSGIFGAIERVNDHLPVPPPFQPRQRLWKISAKQSVLCSGASERPLAFPDNDRPGIMLAGAARAYCNRFGARIGESAAVIASTDDGWRAALDLRAAGVEIAVIVDSRAAVPAELQKMFEGRQMLLGAHILRAHGGQGGVHEIEALNAQGQTVFIRCDSIMMSGGFTPAISLAAHHGAKPVWDQKLQAFLAGPPPPGMRLAGAAAGVYDAANCLKDGARQGAAAAAACGMPPTPLAVPVMHFEIPDSAGLAAPPIISPKPLAAGFYAGKTFIDFQNDVTDKDLQLAEREGYSSVEHAKRYTTWGMATDQGRNSAANGLAVLAAARNAPMADIGVTQFRPPFGGVSIGAMAGPHRGEHFRPSRLPPSHQWAKEQNAVFVDAGQWLRAQYFPKPGETHWLESVVREVKAVRSNAGVCDVSTLGKIDIQGPDAGELLEKVYVNSWKTLAIGRARYGLMLREDGMVLDDGTTARLGEQHFVMTTTTANAAKVMSHLEYARQVLWPHLDVQLASITDQWAQYSLAGPNARTVLQRIVDPAFDISDAAFPPLAAASVTALGGRPARLFRVSFSGELAFEIAMPARLGDGLMRAIMNAGEDFGVTPYGTEALGIMRIEKGHVGGPELNGQTTPRDLGLERMVSRKKLCVGQRLLERPALNAADRWGLVGVKPTAKSAHLRAGAHLMHEGDPMDARHDQGYVTSAAFSPMLDQWIGLALIAGGAKNYGRRMTVADPLRGGERVVVEVCNPVFYDPDGERMRG